MRVTVRFSFNRNCLKAQHRALELMQSSKWIENICFPKHFDNFTDEYPILAWFNPLVGKNLEQSQAVQNIVNGTSKPAPYLVFGPPGTGKTVTIVESIKQVWKLNENSHILATAPSNSAADLVAERILQSMPPSQVLRLYSPSRDL
jgi:helicase MOV-10